MTRQSMKARRMSHHVLLLNGPNLNMLGQRQSEIYGHDTLSDINQRCANHATGLQLTVEAKQSNHEGEMVEWIQQARNTADAIIINAAAYTHTSIAIRDALAMFDNPIIEVHLSNIHEREVFRQHSYISDLAARVIMGHGAEGYIMALDELANIL